MREKRFPEEETSVKANEEPSCGSFSYFLFSFSLGSEVLFGLLFAVVVYKHDFCTMGTGSLADTFLNFLYYFSLIRLEVEQ